jgi:hypothetical protein
LPLLVPLQFSTLWLLVVVAVVPEAEAVAVSVLLLVFQLLLEQLIQSLLVRGVQVHRLGPIAEKTGLLVLILVSMA